MKNLNKKIGAMVLAGMMVAGGVGLSSLAVSHADSPDILVMASYNSDNPEDNKIFLREFGGWWNDYISGQKIKIRDLGLDYEDMEHSGMVFNDREHLESYLKEKKFPPGVYLASIKPRAHRESQNLNIFFEYKL